MDFAHAHRFRAAVESNAFNHGALSLITAVRGSNCSSTVELARYLTSFSYAYQETTLTALPCH
jgi:hypothetical protein